MEANIKYINSKTIFGFGWYLFNVAHDG